MNTEFEAVLGVRVECCFAASCRLVYRINEACLSNRPHVGRRSVRKKHKQYLSGKIRTLSYQWTLQG